MKKISAFSSPVISFCFSVIVQGHDFLSRKICAGSALFLHYFTIIYQGSAIQQFFHKKVNTTLSVQKNVIFQLFQINELQKTFILKIYYGNLPQTRNFESTIYHVFYGHSNTGVSQQQEVRKRASCDKLIAIFLFGFFAHLCFVQKNEYSEVEAAVKHLLRSYPDNYELSTKLCRRQQRPKRIIWNKECALRCFL